MATKREVLNHGKVRWEVDFGLDATGKKRRRFFKTEKKADDILKEHAKALKRGEEFLTRMTKVDRQSTIAILQQMKAQSVSLGRVWEDWQRWQKETQEITTEPMAYEDVVTEWKRRKLLAGKSERYVYHAGVDLMKFGKGQERRNIHEIRADDLEKYIDSQRIQKRGPTLGQPWGLSTKRTNMALFSSLWKVAIDKGWATVNIVDRLEPVGKLGRQKKIYPNEMTLNLMAGTMMNAKTQTVLAPMVLGFFGCMRPDEITSEKPKSQGLPPERWFGWKDIDLEHGLVSVSTDVAKTGDERVIRLQPVAVEWLKLAKELKNPLPPVGEARTVEAICKLIGLDEWIRDGLRKNCATHLRVIYKNDYEVGRDMGHSARTLIKDYADLRTPDGVSQEHWLISTGMVKEYMKSRKWLEVLRNAADKADSARMAAIKAGLNETKPKANEGETSHG
jgi:hypothetical protein